MIRRILICAAFSTCCFLNTWVELAEGKSPYYARYDPLWNVVPAVLCLQVAITLLLLFAWHVCGRFGLLQHRAPHFAFLLACLVPLGIACVALMRLSPVDVSPLVNRMWFWLVAFLVSLPVLIFAIAFPLRASQVIRDLLLSSIPVLALVLIQAGRHGLFKYADASYSDRALASPLDSRHTNHVRVVWIVFDELSQAIAFTHRPTGLALPNLDRLRSESFYATAAHAPAAVTERSIPSLLLGTYAEKIIPERPDRLLVLTRLLTKPADLAMQSTVFDTARDLGLNSALVGWYLPYGRIFNAKLTRCYWMPMWQPSGVEESSTPRSLVTAVEERARLQLAALPLVGHLPGMFPGFYQRENKRLQFLYLLDRAKDVAADPAIGLAFLHFPIPHPPAIYSRSLGTLTARGPINYLDNLALADVTLGELRQAMEKAGVWDRTAVLVSADHGWRVNTWRGNPEWTADEDAASHGDTMAVPFLLRLPGESTSISFDGPFNTVISRRIVAEILSGRISDPAAIEPGICAP